jgi:hypothetical protein
MAFVNLFRDTCMQHLAKPQALRADLDAKGLNAVPPADTGPFLGGHAGQTWVIPDNSVVALRDDGVCAVFARQAVDRDVQLFFNALVQATESPALPTFRNPDKHLQTPTGPVTYISYVQGKPESRLRISLALSTTSSVTAGVQAMATLSLIQGAASTLPGKPRN